MQKIIIILFILFASQLQAQVNYSLDTKFGKGGELNIPPTVVGASNVIIDFSLQGRNILVAVVEKINNNSKLLMYVIDKKSNSESKPKIVFSRDIKNAYASAVKTNKKFMLMYHTGTKDSTRPVSVLAFNKNGELDTDFGKGGEATFNIYGSGAFINKTIFSTNEKFIILKVNSQNNNVTVPALIKLDLSTHSNVINTSEFALGFTPGQELFADVEVINNAVFVYSRISTLNYFVVKFQKFSLQTNLLENNFANNGILADTVFKIKGCTTRDELNYIYYTGTQLAIGYEKIIDGKFNFNSQYYFRAYSLKGKFLFEKANTIIPNYYISFLKPPVNNNLQLPLYFANKVNYLKSEIKEPKAFYGLLDNDLNFTFLNYLPNAAMPKFLEAYQIYDANLYTVYFNNVNGYNQGTISKYNLLETIQKAPLACEIDKIISYDNFSNRSNSIDIKFTLNTNCDVQIYILQDKISKLLEVKKFTAGNINYKLNLPNITTSNNFIIQLTTNNCTRDILVTNGQNLTH